MTRAITPEAAARVDGAAAGVAAAMAWIADKVEQGRRTGDPNWEAGRRLRARTTLAHIEAKTFVELDSPPFPNPGEDGVPDRAEQLRAALRHSAESHSGGEAGVEDLGHGEGCVVCATWADPADVWDAYEDAFLGASDGRIRAHCEKIAGA